MFDEFKHSMKKKFVMTDRGIMRYVLGVEIMQYNNGIFIYQRFGKEICKLVFNPIVPGCKLAKDNTRKRVDSITYKQMVRCLIYFLAIRLDLAYSMCLIARYMEKPTEIHMAAVKRFLRYLKGTINYGLVFEKGKGEKLIGWSDSDHA